MERIGGKGTFGHTVMLGTTCLANIMIPSNLQDVVSNGFTNVRFSAPLVKIDGLVAHLSNIYKARDNEVFRDEISNLEAT